MVRMRRRGSSWTYARGSGWGDRALGTSSPLPHPTRALILTWSPHIGPWAPPSLTYAHQLKILHIRTHTPWTRCFSTTSPCETLLSFPRYNYDVSEAEWEIDNDALRWNLTLLFPDNMSKISVWLFIYIIYVRTWGLGVGNIHKCGSSFDKSETI